MWGYGQTTRPFMGVDLQSPEWAMLHTPCDQMNHRFKLERRMEEHEASTGRLRPKCQLYSNEKVRQVLQAAVDVAYDRAPCELPLTSEDLAPVDMLHYLGSQSLETFGRAAGLGPESRVADVGAGVGGPARFLCRAFGCRVTAIEYLQEFCKAGAVLNRLALAAPDHVEFMCGDVCQITRTHPQLQEAHDALVAQLCILHIKDKRTALKQMAALLKDGGTFMIEDYFLRHDMTEEEARILEDDVDVPDARGLMALDQWRVALNEAGLEVEVMRDETVTWSKFIWSRLESFLAHADYNRSAFSATFVEGQLHFYTQVARLFPAPIHAINNNGSGNSHRSSDTAVDDYDLWESLGYPLIASMARSGAKTDLARVKPELDISVEKIGRAIGGVYIMGRKKNPVEP